jgi:hypothetical protein
LVLSPLTAEADALPPSDPFPPLPLGKAPGAPGKPSAPFSTSLAAHANGGSASAASNAAAHASTPIFIGPRPTLRFIAPLPLDLGERDISTNKMRC